MQSSWKSLLLTVLVVGGLAFLFFWSLFWRGCKASAYPAPDRVPLPQPGDRFTFGAAGECVIVGRCDEHRRDFVHEFNLHRQAPERTYFEFRYCGSDHSESADGFPPRRAIELECYRSCRRGQP